jgi:hypothetical protein
MIRQNAQHVPNLAPRESIVFPEFQGSSQTVQIEYRLATTPDYVNMGWPMIIRIDHNPQPVEPQDRRHLNHYT